MNHLRFARRCRWAPLASALALAAALAPALAGPAAAVVLDDENVITVSLKDGTKVVLYGEADTSVGAPPNLPPANVQAMARRALGGAEEGEKVATNSQVRVPGRAQTSQPVKIAVNEGQAMRLADKINNYSRAPRAVHKGTNRYYYLPPGLHLSQRPDGTPEFLFLKFTTEAREDQGGVSGALMHFLVEWGLTPKQEAEVLTLLRAKVKGAQLMGAVPMEPEGEGATFEVISATLSDKSMATSLVTSGKAPLMPGGKAAVASRLTANGAQLLAATFEKARSITDVSLAVNMSYTTLAPAAKGSITFNWERLEAEKETLSAQYKKTLNEDESEHDCYWFIFMCFDDDKYNYSYNEMREQYRFLEEKQIVHLEWLETRNDEKLNKIREAFFDYFLQSMANPVETTDDGAAAEQAPGAAGGPPPIPEDAARYRYDSEAIKAAMERKIAYFDLNVRLPVKHPLQVVGNLGSWYDAVEDNPKCVASVNLNDPFFQHRDIHFILDLDAKDMFDDAVNYVTVNVRKPRTSGNDFEDHVTIDSKFLKDQGINATVTYARGEDKDPDAYQYRAQWSLRGGVLYPKNPQWQKGRWEGVTLAPPVRPRTIEVEGAIEDMVANDITRITVQIHYLKFGQEVEENISVSPVQGQALVSKQIFLDRGAKGYAYRIIVNHKTKGKLVLPWAARIGDDYIYASIPADLTKEGSPLQAAAQAAAADLINSSKQKVLDRFSELVSGSGAASGGGGGQ